MKKNVVCLLVFWGLLGSVSSACADNGLTRISEHVYAYVDTKGSSPANSFGANAGIIIGERGLAVVDTLISARQARKFLEDIRAVTDKPILYVINTHYHLDHVFGNSVFVAQGATVISHALCLAEMQAKGPGTLASSADFGLSPEEMAGTGLAYPTITFSQDLQLELGNLRVDLVRPAPSHSKGSILVCVNREQVVFAGDVLFAGYHPYLADGDLEGWVTTLDYLSSLATDKIIPGHGPLSGHEELNAMKGYLVAFDAKARKLAAAGASLEEAAGQIKSAMPARAEGEWLIQANLKAKYLVASPPH
ncbi:MAG: MBL fold metallo-hydrolase [Desulfobulbaceae bacterium]|nr:MBL fold metallo-hydrolase [Desulfobulbaceae bacterium]HIJ79270.1 MBL fold metallo-hydrolase [Deltaproteobacteria bacterium]